MLSKLSGSGRPGKRLRLIASLFGYAGIAIALFSFSFWLVFFAQPGTEPPLHAPISGEMRMIMAAKVSLLDSDGRPLGGAVAVLDNQYQAVADNDGVVYFEHLMYHDHLVNITYQGEHYRQHLHVHAEANSVTFGMSLEAHHTLSLVAVYALGLWLLIGCVWAFRARRSTSSRRDAAGQPVAARFKFGGWLVPARLLMVSSLIAALGLGIVVFSSNLQEVQAANPTSTNVPVPANVNVEEDDHNAILTWNGGTSSNDPNPANVSGYKVSWGLAGQPLSNVQLTPYRILQLQPLAYGQSYQASVQALDYAGNASGPSQTVTFASNTNRVNALRARMTGFFDDFNRAAGAPDELKWNVAYSNCNNPSNNGFFINTQFHAHSSLATVNCDRGQNVSRPRNTFDFTNRTGSITFDFDGEFRRDQWYLDLVEQPLDIGGQVSLESGGTANHPGNTLRIHQNEQKLEILVMNANGVESNVAVTDFNPYSSLEWAGLRLVPNVRRHWEIKVSRTQAEIIINGQTVLKGNINLPFSKATVLWNEFSYNTPKSNEPNVLGHWDNFGFDGPASNIETHNYRTAGYGGFDYAEVNAANVNRTITIPDSLAGATAQRLIFTQQMSQGWYHYSSSDKVIINGTTYNLAAPTGAVSDPQVLINSINPYTTKVDIGAGVLKTGANTVQFYFGGSSGVTNVHAEVDFPKGSAPSYTNPELVNPLVVIPSVADIGPGATIESFNDVWLGTAGKVTEPPAQVVHPVSGNVNVKLVVQNEVAMNGTGVNPGIKKVVLWLDRAPIWTRDVIGIPSFQTTYIFNTTLFPNGQHELYLVAYNANNTASMPDYFDSAAKAGDYYPIKINISNAGGPTPTTPATTTPATTTAPPTTVAPTTAPPTTVKPTTAPPTTTVPPTTAPPTTAPPTTVVPTTAPPTTVAPTTAPPTTVVPTTAPPTTVVPTTAPPTTTRPPTTTVPPTTPPTQGGQYGVKYTVANSWGNGYLFGLDVINNGSKPVENWRISWQLANNENLRGFWNADCSKSGNTVTCTNMSYNGKIGPNGGVQSLGGVFDGPGVTIPTSFVINGVTVQNGPPNLLQNAGFENDKQGWYCSGGVKVIQNPVHSGTRAVELSNNTWDDCHQDIALKAGKTYQLSAYILADTDKTPMIGLEDYKTGTWYKSQKCTRSSSYTLCTLTFTPPRDDVFGIYFQAQQGAFKLDDVSLTEK